MSEFKLANGLVLVVVPDNRAPVVTHIVYIRAGAATTELPAGQILQFTKQRFAA